VIPPGPDDVPRRTSPDGSVVVLFTSHDVRMSVWVNEPAVYRARDGALLVDFDSTLLDAGTGLTFPGPHRVRLPLRKYPRGDQVRYDLLVDVEAETFAIGPGEPVRPLAEIARAVHELQGARPTVRLTPLEAGACPDCGGELAALRFLGIRRPGRRCRRCGRVWPD
jgi:hypothetical protein